MRRPAPARAPPGTGPISAQLNMATAPRRLFTIWPGDRAVISADVLIVGNGLLPAGRSRVRGRVHYPRLRPGVALDLGGARDKRKRPEQASSTVCEAGAASCHPVNGAVTVHVRIAVQITRLASACSLPWTGGTPTPGDLPSDVRADEPTVSVSAAVAALVAVANTLPGQRLPASRSAATWPVTSPPSVRASPTGCGRSATPRTTTPERPC